ncbi:UNVERIFIED_CONTAM: hypothetical protein H355_007845 [Colinus virginianus]|nr:hypothetical protein H355_007845 [Colinus virginianus]
MHVCKSGRRPVLLLSVQKRDLFPHGIRRNSPPLLDRRGLHSPATRELSAADALIMRSSLYNCRVARLSWALRHKTLIKTFLEEGLKKSKLTTYGQYQNRVPFRLFGAHAYHAFVNTVKTLSFYKADSNLLTTKAAPVHHGSTLPFDNYLNVTQDSLRREALHDPVAFWEKQAAGIHWFTRYTSAFDETRAPFHRWFPGGTLNACYEAVDVHVQAGRGGKCAIVYDSPVTGVKRKISYSDLLERVRAFAAALVRRGVARGDRVLVYMPLVPEAVVAMLACARIGAIHVVTFGGFGRVELATRIDHAKPKAVVAASCGIESRRVVPYKAGLEQALQLAQHKPEFLVLLQRPQYTCERLATGDIEWDRFVEEETAETPVRVEGADQSTRAKVASAANSLKEKIAAAAAEGGPAPVASNHPLYILYTSGTTGNPKGVVRDHVGQCVSSLYAGGAVYGISPEDVVFCTSDLGWVLGHSVMVYGSLINGATTVMFEGKPTTTPDAGHKDLGIKYKQTRSLLCPVGRKIDYIKTYLSRFPGFYDTGDSGFFDEDGYLYIEGRTDDVLNVSAHRLSTLAIEEVLLRHPAVAAAAVVAVGDSVKGQVPVGVIVPRAAPTSQVCHEGERVQTPQKSSSTRNQDFCTKEAPDAQNSNAASTAWAARHTESQRATTGERHRRHPPDIPDRDLATELVKDVRENIGSFVCFKSCVVVRRLPHTRSGKILRKTIALILQGREYAVPATIEDPSALVELERAVKEQLRITKSGRELLIWANGLPDVQQECVESVHGVVRSEHDSWDPNTVGARNCREKHSHDT